MNILKLFESGLRVEAIVLAGVAFLAGALFALALSKVCRICARKGAANKKPSANGLSNCERSPDDIEIYVGNLSYDLTEDALMKEFAPFGPVSYCRIIINKYTKRSRGYGFVHMKSSEDVKNAIAKLNGKELLGRAMRCNISAASKPNVQS